MSFKISLQDTIYTNKTHFSCQDFSSHQNDTEEFSDNIHWPRCFFYLRTLKSTILLLQSFLFSPITSRRSTHIQRFKSSFRLDAEYSRFSSGLRQHRNGIFSIFSNTQLFTACRSVKRNCLV